MVSDEQLVKQYLSGDEGALRVLFERYVSRIYNFIYRYTGGKVDADDIAQEAFVRAWKNLKRFDEKKSFRTWIFAIAKNAALDSLKKKKAVLFSDFEGEDETNVFEETISDPLPLPDEIFDRADIARFVSSSLEELSPRYRIVLILHYTEDFTFQEIADSLGEPLNTVKSRHRRALLILRKILEQKGLGDMHQK